MNNEITRIVAIDVDGKKVQIEVHIHLSQDEIERIVAPAVLKSLSNQLHMANRPVAMMGERAV